MEPAIGVGDGVVRVPAGDIQQGDVVVFDQVSGEQQRTIHRVVEETPQGFVTKGDNNRVTDQAAGHPHVQRSQIHGKALALGGSPVTIPYVGALADHRTVILTSIVVLLILDFAIGSASSRPSRPRTSREVVRLMTAIAAAFVICVLVLGGSTAQLTFVAIEGGSNAATTIPANQQVTEAIVIEGVTRSPLMHVAVDADSLTVTGQTWRDSGLLLSVRVPPQDPATAHDALVRVHSYPMTLPPAIIDKLHAIHPLVAAGATTAVLVFPLYVLGLVLVGRHGYVPVGRSGLVRRTRLWYQRFGQ
jgi:signal peptidase